MLAAGRGERLWPLTETRPKHLLPLGGRPVLERTLLALAKAGISSIVLVVNYKEEMIRSSIGNGSRLDCRVEYVRQKKLGGTADALNSCRGELKGEDRFLVIYGDDYYDPGALARFAMSSKKQDGIIMGTAEVEDRSRFGSLKVKQGLVVAIHEKLARTDRGRVNAGVYFMDESVLRTVRKTRRSPRGEYELTDSLKILIRQGKLVHAFALREGEWHGLSYPWDLLKANRLVLEKQPRSNRGKLEEGVRVSGPISIGSGCIVKSGTYLEGPVLLAEGTVVGPNSYLRPYTSVGKNAKVGAGCEVKNSILMDEVKLPHMSYVGDSIIGQGSSLGAGTITANLRFDEAIVRSRVRGGRVSSGRRKLGTVLGDNVKTGVNVSLYPGVKLGTGAWVEPGAIVRDDVPSGVLVKGNVR